MRHCLFPLLPFFLILFHVLEMSRAEACSVPANRVEPSLETLFRGNAYIFAAEVLNIKEGNVNLRVLQSWKGGLSGEATVLANNGMCGFSFQPNFIYLVYANKSPGASFLSVGEFGGTRYLGQAVPALTWLLRQQGGQSALSKEEAEKFEQNQRQKQASCWPRAEIEKERECDSCRVGTGKDLNSEFCRKCDRDPETGISRALTRRWYACLAEARDCLSIRDAGERRVCDEAMRKDYAQKLGLPWLKNAEAVRAEGSDVVGDLPRPLFKKYDELLGKAGGSNKILVEKCEKTFYSTLFLLTDGAGTAMSFAFGGEGSNLGENYSFYKKERSCKPVDMAALKRPATATIPPAVMADYEKMASATPKLNSLSIKVCQKESRAIFGVEWGTGYVGGTHYFGTDGTSLGNNSGDDTGGGSRSFDDSGFRCDRVYPNT